VAQQPRQALLATQAAGTARFTQTLTFTSKDGETVQTSEGRLDFSRSRASGSLKWKIAEDLPPEAKDALLGTQLGEGRSPERSRVAIDPATVRLRAGEADYWLRYEESEPFEASNTIDALRGSEAAFGGTLLEMVSGARQVKQAPGEGGGRDYTTSLTAFNALAPFSTDLRGELTSSIDPRSEQTPVTLDLTVDRQGRITRAEADLSALLGRKDSALDAVTGLHATLTLTGFGTSAPVMPPATERTLSAREHVKPVDEVKPGGCVDLSTGMRASHMVVVLPCEQPHDARVLAHIPFGPDHPGDEEARRQAEESCGRAYRSAPGAWTRKSAEKDGYWYILPTEDGWGRDGTPAATCYVLSR
jgi:hypothetical protein